jgi:hypothetical protein
MSQRISGFERRPSEDYATIEAWPVRALVTHLPIRSAWDPCAGGGTLLAAPSSAALRFSMAPIRK